MASATKACRCRVEWGMRRGVPFQADYRGYGPELKIKNRDGARARFDGTYTPTISAFTRQPQGSPPFGSYSLRLPKKGWPGCVGLGGWLNTEINVPHRKLKPDTVTHPSTTRARCRLTSLIETDALPLRQTTTSIDINITTY